MSKEWEVVPADELRVGDTLPTGDRTGLRILRIEEKPKTRVLHLEDEDTYCEDTYRVRRTTRLYIRPRKCFAVAAMIDSYGPCIMDETFTGTLDEAREVAQRWVERATRDESVPGGRPTEWVTITEAEHPGKHHADDIDYGDIVERIEVDASVGREASE